LSNPGQVPQIEGLGNVEWHGFGSMSGTAAD